MQEQSILVPGYYVSWAAFYLNFGGGDYLIMRWEEQDRAGVRNSASDHPQPGVSMRVYGDDVIFRNDVRYTSSIVTDVVGVRRCRFEYPTVAGPQQVLMSSPAEFDQVVLYLRPTMRAKGEGHAQPRRIIIHGTSDPDD